MKSEKEIREKLQTLESELETINNLDGDHLQEYGEKYEQIRLIKWVLN
jgi:DNA-dependent RNA polymerase auxiliary subunit epsilon